MTGRHLSIGCLFLLSVAGPCYYYYFKKYPQVQKIVIQEQLSPRCILTFPHNLTLEKSTSSWVWKQVDPKFKWYVNSAYLDRRLKTHLIRIVAMSKETQKQTLYCQVWLEGEMLTIVEAQQQELWIDAWDRAKPGRYYHPYLLLCQITPQIKDPILVSISVDDPCTLPKHALDISRNHKESQERFVVCLKPLHFESDISSRLIEWLELQFLLGANSIFVYVKQIHPKTQRVLEHYEKSGKLTMIQHTVPGTDVKGLWQKRRHEIAVYNDCFYRHLESHQFVVNLDLDEAILPVLHDSWSQLLANHSTSACFSVRCVYFFDSLGEEESIPQNFHMLRHVYRSAQFAPPGFAQKSFFSTKNTEAVSNHFALRAVAPNIRLLSGFDVHKARLHHYRKECPPKMEHECNDNFLKFWQRDTLIWKYKDKIEKNVLHRTQEIFN